MRERLWVSHPASGFGIYLPKEAEMLLGGVDARVNVEYQELENGKTRFVVTPNKKGKKYIRVNVRGSTETRIFWSSKSVLPPPIEYHFGKVYLDWEIEGKGISFLFPRIGELKSAHTKTYGGKPKRKHVFGIGG